MKIYNVTMGGYRSRIEALDRQHARSKFTNNLFKTEQGFPVTENLGSITATEIDGENNR